MSTTELQMHIIKSVSQLENEDALKQLSLMVEEFVKSFDSDASTEINDDEKPSFEEWNEQFTDEGKSLDDFIPEYGMTLRKFRMGIYESEMGETIPVEEFKKKLRCKYEEA